MCGICGFVDLNKRSQNRKDLIRKMTSILSHRGPDGEGYYENEDKGVFLGMRRLAVIDLKTGMQPITNEDETVHVVYNGEIYNYRELRVELKRKGHIFQTESDTEILVHLYEEYGENFVCAINGMFAIALIDSRKNKMLLVRDRMGIKPLFYYHDSRKFIFSSEIKGIISFPGLEKSVDPESLIDFLSLNYVIAPSTLFKNIYQLVPGQMILMDLNTNNFSKKQYWEIEIQPDYSLQEEEVLEHTDYLLRDAIRCRLISDVPLGAFLSGGVDSSAIVAIMSEYITWKPLKTFSIGFDEPSFNEIKWAKMVSEQYQTEHHEIILNADALNLLPLLVWSSEEPTADASALSAYNVSKIARDEVTVILSGDGADEIFGGYDTYNIQKYLKLWKTIPHAFRRMLKDLIELLPERTKKNSPEMLIKRFVKAADMSKEEAHFMWRMIFYENERETILNKRYFLSNNLDKYNPFSKCSEYFQKVSHHDFLNQMLFVDSRFYLPNDMITRMDRASMAVSLEARVPFMDHRLVEYLFNVPPEIKFKYGKKYILKKILHNRLPPEVLYRKKQGFNVPMGHWFRGCKSAALRNILGDLGGSIPFLNLEKVFEIIAEHASGKKDNGYKLWCVLVFMIWYHTFILREDITNPIEISF